MKNLTVAMSVLLTGMILLTLADSTAIHTSTVQQWGELEFTGDVITHVVVFNGHTSRNTLRTDALPAYVLEMVQRAMEYALEQDAARSISADDMYHAHLALETGGATTPNMSNVASAHIHTQEHVRYETESFRKRNVFVDRDNVPRILPCPPNNPTYCTVAPASPSVTVRLVVVDDDIPTWQLRAYAHNIVQVGEQRVLVGLEHNTLDVLAIWFERTSKH